LFVTYILTEDMSLWLIFFLHNYKGLIQATSSGFYPSDDNRPKEFSLLFFCHNSIRFFESI